MFDYLNFKFYIFTFLLQWNLNSINLNMICTTKNILWNFINLKSTIVKYYNIFLFIYMNW